MNGYIQLEIGGKLRGLKFGNAYLYILKELVGSVSPDDIQEKIQDKHWQMATNMVYAGLSANCRIKNEDPDFTWQQVSEWLDDVPETELLKVVKVCEDAVNRLSDATMKSIEAIGGDVKKKSEQPGKTP